MSENGATHQRWVGPRLPMAQPLRHCRLRQPHRPADRPKPPPRVAPPPRTIRPPRTRPSRAARAAPGLLVRATRPVSRAQPLRGRRRRHRRRRRRHRPLVLALTPCSPCSSTFTRSSRRSFSFRKMHTDMGDERGIRLRCICLGRAAPRGSRMRGMGRCGKGSESRIARSSLSIARSSVCADCRCLRINITVHQKERQAPVTLRIYYALRFRSLPGPHGSSSVCYNNYGD